MAQFDVYRLRDGGLVVDCQSNLIGDYETRLVAPLIEHHEAMVAMARLHPRFTVDGTDVVMVTQLATAVRTRELRSPVATLGDHRDAIVGAIDMLVAGF